MMGNNLTLSLEMYGCIVVCRYCHSCCVVSTFVQAIDGGTPEQQSVIVSELSGHILKCVKDSNGNHVSASLASAAEG